MHLAYLDESGTGGHSPIVMFGALIVPIGRFGPLSSLHSAAVQQIISADKINEFQEFHAYDLYNGTGIFDGVDEIRRFRAIQVLLGAVKMEELVYVYSAVDRKKFADSPFGSGSPLLAAFRMCLLGVEDWATANHQGYPPSPGQVKQIDWNDTYLCIMDDWTDKPLKGEFRKAYYSLRSKHPFVPPTDNKLWHAHDDVFFADSKDCLGVQIADLCGYFVRRHLAGDAENYAFYNVIEDRIQCAKPEPEWTNYKNFFREHISLAALSRPTSGSKTQ